MVPIETVYCDSQQGIRPLVPFSLLENVFPDTMIPNWARLSMHVLELIFDVVLDLLFSKRVKNDDHIAEDCRFRPEGQGPIYIDILLKPVLKDQEIEGKINKRLPKGLKKGLEKAGYIPSIIRSESDHLPSPNRYLMEVKAIYDSSETETTIDSRHPTSPEIRYTLFNENIEHIVKRWPDFIRSHNVRRDINRINDEAIIALNKKLREIQKPNDSESAI